MLGVGRDLDLLIKFPEVCSEPRGKLKVIELCRFECSARDLQASVCFSSVFIFVQNSASDLDGWPGWPDCSHRHHNNITTTVSISVGHQPAPASREIVKESGQTGDKLERNNSQF